MKTTGFRTSAQRPSPPRGQQLLAHSVCSQPPLKFQNALICGLSRDPPAAVPSCIQGFRAPLGCSPFGMMTFVKMEIPGAYFCVDLCTFYQVKKKIRTFPHQTQCNICFCWSTFNQMTLRIRNLFPQGNGTDWVLRSRPEPCTSLSYFSYVSAYYSQLNHWQNKASPRRLWSYHRMSASFLLFVQC